MPRTLIETIAYSSNVSNVKIFHPGFLETTNKLMDQPPVPITFHPLPGLSDGAGGSFASDDFRAGAGAPAA